MYFFYFFLLLSLLFSIIFHLFIYLFIFLRCFKTRNLLAALRSGGSWSITDLRQLDSSAVFEHLELVSV